MGPRRRVVITGLGVIAPNGIGKEAFWKNLVAGKSAVDYITAFDASPYPCQVAAEVRDFKPEQFMNPRRTRHRGRFSQFAVAAAKLAVEDAGLRLDEEPAGQVMACVGSSMIGLSDVYETARLGFDSIGMPGIPPTTLIEVAAHAPVSHVSVELGIRGQAMTLASACATGIDVIQWGCMQIAEGHAAIVLAGSTEAPFSESCFASFGALGALSTFGDPPEKASRPYDARRSGLVLGEGAAICVLEEAEHALARRATIYGEVLGFGSGNEGGYSMRVNASEMALVDAIHSALGRAQLDPNDIDHINAHGNALPDFDLVETSAFKRAFGQHAYNIPTSSIKSMIGHAIGAGASFQVVAACLALQNSVLPPTINLDTPDPDCDLDYVAHRARVSRVRHVLVNAHAMGGTHSVLVLGRFQSSR